MSVCAVFENRDRLRNERQRQHLTQPRERVTDYETPTPPYQPTSHNVAENRRNRRTGVSASKHYPIEVGHLLQAELL